MQHALFIGTKTPEGNDQLALRCSILVQAQIDIIGFRCRFHGFHGGQLIGNQRIIAGADLVDNIPRGQCYDFRIGQQLKQHCFRGVHQIKAAHIAVCCMAFQTIIS